MPSITNYDGREYKKKCNCLRSQIREKEFEYRVYTIEKYLTVCIARKNGIYARGYTVCSPNDNYCRAVGNFYAMRYLLAAIKHEDSLKPVVRKEPWVVLGKIYDNNVLEKFSRYKSDYQVVPTKNEQSLFENSKVA